MYYEILKRKYDFKEPAIWYVYLQPLQYLVFLCKRMFPDYRDV